jgi:hypothetical protein
MVRYAKNGCTKIELKKRVGCSGSWRGVVFGRRDRITLWDRVVLFVISFTAGNNVVEGFAPFSFSSHYFARAFIASVIVRMTIFWETGIM